MQREKKQIAVERERAASMKGIQDDDEDVNNISFHFYFNECLTRFLPSLILLSYHMHMCRVSTRQLLRFFK
jgi:hypothetical protein